MSDQESKLKEKKFQCSVENKDMKFLEGCIKAFLNPVQVFLRDLRHQCKKVSFVGKIITCLVYLQCLFDLKDQINQLIKFSIKFYNIL
jgi:hypothetical protein